MVRNLVCWCCFFTRPSPEPEPEKQVVEEQPAVSEEPAVAEAKRETEAPVQSGIYHVLSISQLCVLTVVKCCGLTL